MKNRVIVCMLIAQLVLLAGGITAGAADAPGKGKYSAYSAAVQYPGVYKAKGIYYRTHGTEGWVPIVRYFTNEITCPEAVNQLANAGYWKGNLLKNGTCGPKAEPMEWATGNRLNHSAAAEPGNKLPEAKIRPVNEDD